MIAERRSYILDDVLSAVVVMLKVPNVTQWNSLWLLWLFM